MRIVRFSDQTGGDKNGTMGVLGGGVGQERVVAAGGTLSALDPAWFDPEGPAAALLRAAAAKPASSGKPLGEVTLLAPVARPGKIICIGLNYRDHAIESGMDIPKSPVMFAKFATSIAGPGQAVIIPPGCEKPDYEAELAVIIGQRAQRVTVAAALDHVFGYACLNDVSARDFQFADGQWTRGKAADTFAPIGPTVVTRDEVKDPHNLRIQLRLNGQSMQDSNTQQLIFNIPEIVAFLSRSMTLEPGDVIATGTPPGVGFARKPPVFLRPGDKMEVEIEGLGILENPVTAA